MDYLKRFFVWIGDIVRGRKRRSVKFIDKMLTGCLVFPLIAVLFTFPYMLYQYHKYGSINKYRTVIIYSFILYMIIAYFQVILPLPVREATVGNRWQDHLNLIPGRQIWIFWRDKPFTKANVIAYLKSFRFWQLLLNVVLTIPFGIYLRYYFRQSLSRTILFSFLLSLFYELTQLTALYGIYPGPYRLADVEDLICNTMGGAVGYGIAQAFSRVLPKREKIDAESLEAGRVVSGMRRITASVFDGMCVTLLFLLAGGIADLFDPGAGERLDTMTNYWNAFCLLYLLQVLLTRGVTIGHAVCRMRLVSEDGSLPPRRRLFLRYLLLWLFTALPVTIAEAFSNGLPKPVNVYLVIGSYAVSRLYFLYYFFREVFPRKAKPMPHDRLSRTVYVSAVIPEEKQ